MWDQKKGVQLEEIKVEGARFGSEGEGGSERLLVVGMSFHSRERTIG